MKCPNKKCRNTKKFTEVFRSKTDNLNGLDHSHFQCDVCGQNFNVWNEPIERLKKLLINETYL